MRIEMGRQSVEIVKEKFSTEKMIENYKLIVEKIGIWMILDLLGIIFGFLTVAFPLTLRKDQQIDLLPPF